MKTVIDQIMRTQHACSLSKIDCGVSNYISKVNSVQEACFKCFVVQILKIESLQVT